MMNPFIIGMLIAAPSFIAGYFVHVIVINNIVSKIEAESKDNN